MVIVFIQQVVNGLMLGSMYALLAIGYTLVLGILHMLNMAHPQVFMISAYLGLAMMTALSMPIWLAIVVSVIGAGILSNFVELTCFRPVDKKYLETPLLTTFCMGILLEFGVTAIYGTDPKAFPSHMPIGDLQFGGIFIPSVQLLALVLSVLLMLGVDILLYRTKLGRSIRAVAINPSVASLLGINVNVVVSAIFFVSGFLGGAAAIFSAIRMGGINSSMGWGWGMKALAVMVIGGMGNVRGAMVGGLIIGVIEVLSIAYLSASYSDMVIWGALILILTLKKGGLFKVQLRELP